VKSIRAVLSTTPTEYRENIPRPFVDRHPVALAGTEPVAREWPYNTERGTVDGVSRECPAVRIVAMTEHVVPADRPAEPRV
jgi:hypothetical protein